MELQTISDFLNKHGFCGSEIRLEACNLGTLQNGNYTFASDLARLTGKEVIAYPHYTYAKDDGSTGRANDWYPEIKARRPATPLRFRPNGPIEGEP